MAGGRGAGHAGGERDAVQVAGAGPGPHVPVPGGPRRPQPAGSGSLPGAPPSGRAALRQLHRAPGPLGPAPHRARSREPPVRS